MAKMYVSWHKYSTKAIGSTVLADDGPLIASAVAVDISAGGVTPNAPQGAEYATVWADVPFYYLAGATPAKDTTAKPWPANLPVRIAVNANSTKIAGYAI